MTVLDRDEWSRKHPLLRQDVEGVGEHGSARPLVSVRDSRSHTYQERHRAAGLCSRCPRPIYLGGVHCEKHCIEARLRYRKRTGSKAWVKGRRGRPPLEASE